MMGELSTEIGCGEEPHHTPARPEDGEEKGHVDRTPEPDDLDQMVIRREILCRHV